MIRSEESKAAWNAATVAQDWATVDAIELEWKLLAEPIPFYSSDENYIWENEDDRDYSEFAAMCDDSEWTNEDEAGLEEYEENKRRRISEQNEY